MQTFPHLKTNLLSCLTVWGLIWLPRHSSQPPVSLLASQEIVGNPVSALFLKLTARLAAIRAQAERERAQEEARRQRQLGMALRQGRNIDSDLFEDFIRQVGNSVSLTRVLQSCCALCCTCLFVPSVCSACLLRYCDE